MNTTTLKQSLSRAKSRGSTSKIFFIFLIFLNLNSLEFTKKLSYFAKASKDKFLNITKYSRLFSTKKSIIINKEHIFNIQQKTLNGLHHDYQRKLETAGYFHLKNIKQMPNGVYQGQILKKLPNGKKVHSTKTFFPKDWTREQVIEKIFEAYNNYKEELSFLDSKAVITTETNEGIKIRMVITDAGEILTAFPIIEEDQG